MPTITASPTAAVQLSDSGTVSWSNVSNVLAAGDFATAAAVVPHVTTVTSKAIKVTGFDFSAIDDFDIINSITVILNRKSDRSFCNLTVAYLVESGTLTSIFAESLPTFWTETLAEERLTKTLSLPTAAVLKASTSGVAVAVIYYDGDGSTVTASIDTIELEVVYTDAVTGSAAVAGAVGLRPYLDGLAGIRPCPLMGGRVGIRPYFSGMAGFDK